MTFQDYIALAGVFIASMGSILIPLFRSIYSKIAICHKRIDEVKDNYVRRDDADKNTKRLLDELKFIRDEQSKISSTLQTVFIRLGGKFEDGQR